MSKVFELAVVYDSITGNTDGGIMTVDRNDKSEASAVRQINERILKKPSLKGNKRSVAFFPRGTVFDENIHKIDIETGKIINKVLVEFDGQSVSTKAEVDRITRAKIQGLGLEQKATTEILVWLEGGKTGSKPASWIEFRKKREIIIKEGNDFITKKGLE